MYHLELQVRDYECDMQGVVNNAVYQNYLEHARHEFLKHLGVDFADLVSRSIHLVVIRAELDYIQSLRCGDGFRVAVALERISPLRVAFRQEIQRPADARLILRARIIATVLDARGRPHMPGEMSALLQRVGQTAPG